MAEVHVVALLRRFGLILLYSTVLYSGAVVVDNLWQWHCTVHAFCDKDLATEVLRVGLCYSTERQNY